jgi:hypothetical protein
MSYLWSEWTKYDKLSKFFINANDISREFFTKKRVKLTTNVKMVTLKMNLVTLMSP